MLTGTTLPKRFADLCLAVVMSVLLALPLLGLMLWLLATQGRPVFYVAERMRTPTQGFGLVKLRTMAEDADDGGVTGGGKAARITPQGAILRRYKLDEIPQLWNVLKGDISFVGPRPPLRRYVERHPALYAEVLKMRPGLSGLASLLYHRREEALLSRCATPEETERVYERVCVPRKAALDRLYARRQRFCLDAEILWHTMLGGGRAGRRPGGSGGWARGRNLAGRRIAARQRQEQARA